VVYVRLGHEPTKAAPAPALMVLYEGVLPEPAPSMASDGHTVLYP